MNKYKKIAFLVIASIFVLLLSACSSSTMQVVSEGSQEVKKEPKIYEDTIEIGTKFYEYISDQYIYSGIVNDSVLITVLVDANYQNSNSLPLYIPLSRKSPVELPGTSATIQVKEVNHEEGTIKLVLTEKGK